MKTVTFEKCAELLHNADNILILMHKSPDGDAIGCSYALAHALRKAGKKVMPVCSDDIPKKYGYITNTLDMQNFEPEYIVTVDLADTQLFGDKLIQYKDKVNLCIDHHPSNTGYAEYGIVDANAGACAQIIKKVINALNIPIDKNIANAIFTGISTDTGCFKYSNASAESYKMASEMIEYGADGFFINKLMFDTKSRQRLEIERLALNSLTYHYDGKIAVIFITKEVVIGITIREKDNGNFRVSMRSAGDKDVSAVCAKFGGGGHKAAAGCTVTGTAEKVKEKVILAAGTAL